MTVESRGVACHAPAPCPTRDLCSDSEACSWPLSEDHPARRVDGMTEPTLPRGVAPEGDKHWIAYDTRPPCMAYSPIIVKEEWRAEAFRSDAVWRVEGPFVAVEEPSDA
jgi:hypothetical protein